MQNPTDIVKKVADELKESADESGIGNIDKFLDELNNINEKAKNGPGDALDKAMACLDNLKDSMKNAMDNPAPGDAICAMWYQEAIKSKLKALSDETENIAQSVKSQSTEIGLAFRDLSGTLTQATDGLATTTKNLTSLPNEVTAISESVSDAGDIVKIDTAHLEQACDISGIDKPLDEIASLKKKLGPTLADPVNESLENLAIFIFSAPDKIKEAFQIPKPLCCIQAVVPSPQPMQDILDKIELLSAINVTPVTEIITKTQDSLEGADVEVVKRSIASFSVKAKAKIDDLSKAIDTAKKGAEAEKKAEELAAKLKASSVSSKSLRKFF